MDMQDLFTRFPRPLLLSDSHLQRIPGCYSFTRNQ